MPERIPDSRLQASGLGLVGYGLYIARPCSSRVEWTIDRLVRKELGERNVSYVPAASCIAASWSQSALDAELILSRISARESDGRRSSS
jgi:hypothetical protein